MKLARKKAATYDAVMVETGVVEADRIQLIQML